MPARHRRSGSAATAGSSVSDGLRRDLGAAVARRPGITRVLPSRWPHADPTVFVGHGARACCARATAGRRSRRTALAGHGRASPRVAGAGAGRWPATAACSSRSTRARTSRARARACRRARSSRWRCRRSSRSTPCCSRRPPPAASSARRDGGASWTPSGLDGERVGDLVWLGPFLYAAGENGLLPQRRTSGDAGRGCPTARAGPPACCSRWPRQRASRRFLATDRGLFRTPRRRRALDAVGIRGPGRCSTVATFPPPEPVRARSAAMRFTKAHGLGNDFILVAEADAPAERVGMGARGCATGTAASAATASCCTRASPTACRFRLVNADGLPGEISGNGLRCLAALAVRDGWAPSRHVVHTVVGPKAVEVTAAGGSALPHRDRPRPARASAAATCRSTSSPPAATVIDHAARGRGPHGARDRDVDGQPALRRLLRRAGRRRAPDDARSRPRARIPFFPQRTNVEFVTVIVARRDPRPLLGARRRLHAGLGHRLARARSWPRSSPGRTDRARAGGLRRRHARGRVARGRQRSGRRARPSCCSTGTGRPAEHASRARPRR